MTTARWISVAPLAETDTPRACVYHHCATPATHALTTGTVTRPTCVEHLRVMLKFVRADSEYERKTAQRVVTTGCVSAPIDGASTMPRAAPLAAVAREGGRGAQGGHSSADRGGNVADGPKLP